jgi:ketosteroid isomerase-like protein
MDARASIDALVDRAYAARRNHDVAGAMACFTEDGGFRTSGGQPTTNRAEQQRALKGVFDAFALIAFEQRCRVIDPPRAVVHWRGKFRMKNGNIGELDVLDLIEVQDGRIAPLVTFFDSAYAEKLNAG